MADVFDVRSFLEAISGQKNIDEIVGEIANEEHFGEAAALMNKHLEIVHHHVFEDDELEEPIAMSLVRTDVDVRVDGLIDAPAGIYAVIGYSSEGFSTREVCPTRTEEVGDGRYRSHLILDENKEDYIHVELTVNGETRPIPFLMFAYLVISTAVDGDELTEKQLIAALMCMSPADKEGQEEQEAQTTPVPQLEAISVTTHIVPNSKPTHVLRQGWGDLMFKDGGMPISVGKKMGQATINFGLALEDPVTKISEDIDAEDMAIVEAVTSLTGAGNTTITPFQIAEAMGYTGPTVELQEEIHERVQRLRGIVGRIDFTEQAKAWRIANPDTGKPYDHAEISGNLLSMTIFDGTDTDGNRHVRYQVNAEPITYTHARIVGQVVTYDQKLLELKPITDMGEKRKRVTRDQTKIERAVLWFVFSLKNPKSNLSNVITYDSLFAVEGYVPSSTSARKRAIAFTHDYLRALQEKGVIADFQPIEEGRAGKMTKVRVIVEKPRKRISRRVE